MANEKRLIDKDALIKLCDAPHWCVWMSEIEDFPTVNAYTANEVAGILADLFGDACACNFNGIDEWLPEKCELVDACPNTVGVACWEQYLKFRDAKMDGDAE